MEDRDSKILARIMERKEHNPVYSAELEKEFKISGSEIRKIIRAFRRDGIPVANSKTGYYYARNFKEIEPTIVDLEKRTLSMLSTISALKKNFEKSQLELF
ncbi:MAG TPA: hypothetical protein PLG90_13380 [Ignavibacteria bacterium]|nr:hypothetical protein [Ignavibacteria bacterium]